ncbi:MAG TPA: hypothetical protein VEQ37_00125 [Actinomycetota bacterium]|nr:hypothetical protein [Actinomycetota bacterium]
MRRVLLTFLAVATLMMVASPADADEPPVTRHLHLLTTPNGDTHAIAGGVTFHAPCTAFLNLHEIVHETVFGTPGTGALKNPNGPLVAEPHPELGTCTPDP